MKRLAFFSLYNLRFIDCIGVTKDYTAGLIWTLVYKIVSNKVWAIQSAYSIKKNNKVERLRKARQYFTQCL